METMENNQQNTQQTQTPAPATQNAPAPTVDVEALAEALSARQQRAERSVIKSYAEQSGISVDELTRLVDDYKAQQAAAIPADMQARIDAQMQAANERLIAAEVRTVGAALHLVDIDAAFALMDKSGVAVGEDGSVTGVQEALDALAAAKPWLVAQQQPPTPSGTGSAGNFPRGTGGEQSDYAARLSEARKSGNQTLAVSIIREAAAKGIQLR